MTYFRHILDFVLSVFGTIFFLFEEFLWNALSRLMARFGAFPVVRDIEAKVRKSPPWVAGAILVGIPLIIFTPINLKIEHFLRLAITTGDMSYLLSALAVFALAKVLSMALIARLYAICRDPLCQLRWFLRVETKVFGWRDAAHNFIKSLYFYKKIKSAIQVVREKAREVFSKLRQVN